MKPSPWAVTYCLRVEVETPRREAATAGGTYLVIAFTQNLLRRGCLPKPFCCQNRCIVHLFILITFKYHPKATFLLDVSNDNFSIQKPQFYW